VNYCVTSVIENFISISIRLFCATPDIGDELKVGEVLLFKIIGTFHSCRFIKQGKKVHSEIGMTNSINNFLYDGLFAPPTFTNI